jgi:L-lactate dehydrogenase complex protein LldG
VYCREEKLRQTLRANRFDNFAEVDLADCDAAITGCELLIARTGSIVLSTGAANPSGGRTVSVYAPVHICIAYTDQLVYDIKDGLVILKSRYQDHFPSLVTFATGPSRTADIEKILVVGVHGPKEVYLFLIDR